MPPSGNQPKNLLRLFAWVCATFCTLILLSLVVGVIFLDSLILLVAKPFLSPLDMQLQEITGLQFRRDRVSVTSLRITMPGANEASYVEELDINFNEDGWWATPVRHIRAKRVDINLAQNLSNTGAASSPLLLPPLPSIEELLKLLQSIPSDAVEVERLNVAPYVENGTLSVSSDARELRLQIVAQDTKVDFRVNWHDSNYVSSLLLPQRALDAATPSPQVISGRVLIDALDARVFSTDFTLYERDTRLQIDANSIVQLDALSAFAQRGSLLPASIFSLGGQIDATWYLAEPAPDDDTQGLPFSLNFAANNVVNINLRDTPTAGLHTLRWHNDEELSAQGIVRLGNEALELQIKAPAMTVALGIDQEEPAQISASIDELNIHCSSVVTCSATHSSEFNLPELTWEETGIRNVLLISNGTMALEQGQYSAHFAQGSRLELGSLTIAGMELTQANTLVQQAVDLSITADGTAQLDSGGVDLYLPNINIGGYTGHLVAALSGLSGRLSATQTQLQADVQLRNFGSDGLPFILRKPELDLEVSVDQNAFSATGVMRIADREISQLSWAMDIDSFEGSAQIETPILNFDRGTNSLAQWFFQAPFEADLVAGSIQSNANLQFGLGQDGEWRLNGPVSVDIAEVSGFFQETAIIEMSTHLSGMFRERFDFISDGNRAFSLASIDLGLPVDEISFVYAVDTRVTQFSVESVEARVFGGRVHSTGLDYDWSAPSNTITIDVERIDISKMLALAAYDGIQATGFISGTIPITLNGTTPSVGAGRLAVEAPGGAIHYSSSNGADTGNATLDFVNQALSNYQYNLMETEVEYLPSGELQLGVKLQGHNPDMNDGQRINLNLNISDNIPMLLRSLQSGRSIADALEREMQSR